MNTKFDPAALELALTKLKTAARQAVLNLNRHIDWSADYSQIRPALIEAMMAVGTTHGDAAALLAGHWFETMIDAPLGSAQVLDGALDYAHANHYVRWALRHATTGKPERTMSELAGRAEQHCSGIWNKTVATNIGQNPTTRYEVKLSPGACKKCHQGALKVEGHGFNKTWGGETGDITGDLFHPNCNCQLHPSTEKLPKPKPAKEWRSLGINCPDFTPSVENYRVLFYGLEKGQFGGHLDQKNTHPGKTIAPAWMTEQDVKRAVRLTLDEPQHVYDYRGNTVRLREVDRIIWYAETYTASDGQETYKHIYPLNGDGILANPKENTVSVTERVEVPLNRAVLDVNWRHDPL